MRDELADMPVHVRDHVGEIFHVAVHLLADRLRVPAGATRHGLKRIVGQDHRVVEEEGAVLFAADELERPVLHEIGTIFAVVEISLDAVELKAGIRKARRAARVLPEAVLVEAELLRQPPILAELPLAGDARGIARAAEVVRKRLRLRVHVSKIDVVPDIVDPGHELHARGRAERLHEAALEAHPARGEAIDIRRAVGGAAVGADALVAEIVDEDQNDIRFRRRSRERNGGGK